MLEVAPYCLDAKAKDLAARCHIVAATAEVGLGRREWAVRELRHAFALNPRLELTAETTSPRLLELVSEARTNP